MTLLSVVCGIGTLQQLTGHLEKHEQPSIYAGGIKLTAG